MSQLDNTITELKSKLPKSQKHAFVFEDIAVSMLVSQVQLQVTKSH